MSGGSYGYLYLVDETEVENRLSDVSDMAARLVKLGYPEYAQRFYRFIEKVELMKAQKSAFLQEYEDVMHAVEWTDSGDWSEESLKEFMDKRSKLQQTLKDQKEEV